MADEKKLNMRERLRKLFTSSVIYRPKGKNKTVVVDPYSFMSTGAASGTKASDKYGKIYRNSKGFDIYGANTVYGGSDYSSLIQTRMNLYTDYESMDTNAIISSALDIYADECTTNNEKGEIISIHTNDNEIKESLHNLFYDILDVEYNLWPWVRNMCKYGDTYLGLNVQEGLGIIGVVPLSSYYMVRMEGSEDNPYDVKFKMINPDQSIGFGNRTIYNKLKEKDVDEFESFEIAHFRLLSDTNFLPYGKSSLEGVRKDFKVLLLLEDAMLLHRIMRAPEKRVFKVDIGNLPEEEVDAFMEKIMTGMKKIPHIDEETNQYNLRYNLQNMLEDFYIPVRGDNSGMSIESLPGLEYAPVEDLEFVRSKIFAGLKIPKPFLGYDENMGEKSGLAMMDVRFARTIDRYQKMALNELNKMAIVHLFAQGIEDERLVDFSLSLTNPSIIYEQEKIELFNNKVSLATAMKETKMISREYIYKHVFNLSEEEYKYEAKEALNDIKTIFRESQIESEGNDPALTKESVGTAWDIASLHVRNKLYDDDLGIKDKGGAPEGGQPGAGRPKSNRKYGTDKSNFGRDPLSKRELIGKTFDYDDKINYKYKGGSNFAFENLLRRSKKPKLNENNSLSKFLDDLNN